jgi:NTE family protein
VAFYDAVEQISDWARARRRAVRTPIGIEHLMASAAIPLLFPATRIEVNGQPPTTATARCGRSRPSPRPSTWAQRVLVVGAAARPSRWTRPAWATRPTLAGAGGQPCAASIFLDTLTADAERLHRINHTLSLIEPARRAESALRPIELLTIMPLATAGPGQRHTAALPRPVRTLMAILGMRGAHPARSSALATYLMFEAGFTTELMRLGEADALAQQDAICRFFGWPRSP